MNKDDRNMSYSKPQQTPDWMHGVKSQSNCHGYAKTCGILAYLPLIVRGSPRPSITVHTRFLDIKLCLLHRNFLSIETFGEKFKLFGVISLLHKIFPVTKVQLAFFLFH